MYMYTFFGKNNGWIFYDSVILIRYNCNVWFKIHHGWDAEHYTSYKEICCWVWNNYDFRYIQRYFQDQSISRNDQIEVCLSDVAKQIDLSLSNSIMTDQHCSIKGDRVLQYLNMAIQNNSIFSIWLYFWADWIWFCQKSVERSLIIDSVYKIKKDSKMKNI